MVSVACRVNAASRERAVNRVSRGAMVSVACKEKRVIEVSLDRAA
jgi:hypothetical protein